MLAFHLTTVIIFKVRYQLFKRYSQVIVCILIFMELSFIFITIAAYASLFCFIRSKSRVMKTIRHGGTDLNKRYMMSLTCAYLCWLLFTIPQVANQVIQSSGGNNRSNNHHASGIPGKHYTKQGNKFFMGIFNNLFSFEHI